MIKTLRCYWRILLPLTRAYIYNDSDHWHTLWCYYVLAGLSPEKQAKNCRKCFERCYARARTFNDFSYVLITAHTECRECRTLIYDILLGLTDNNLQWFYLWELTGMADPAGEMHHNTWLAMFGMLLPSANFFYKKSNI